MNPLHELANPELDLAERTKMLEFWRELHGTIQIDWWLTEVLGVPPKEKATLVSMNQYYHRKALSVSAKKNEFIPDLIGPEQWAALADPGEDTP